MVLADLVDDGKFGEARAWVLALWRRKPHATLAALVSELDGHCTTPGAARSALEHVITSGNSVSSRERLASVFETLDAEPYVFDWMVQELGHPRFDVATGNPRRLYELIVEQMAKLVDERVEPWVAALPAFLQARKGRRFGQLSPEEIDALTEAFQAQTFRPPFLEALSADEEAEIASVRAPLDALKERAAARDSQRARLFEQVAVDFDDDVAKEVFADFLLESGDPLGEYIVLGLKLAREGSLPPELEARHRVLSEHARRFQPMGARFERGFAVEARFTDGEGTRRGSYGLEPGWATISKSDVPPTSDDCFTESLQELDLGSTFIADLGKLKKPLAVTKLRWRTPSQAGRPKWKKVKVLPALEELAITQPAQGSYEWLLLEGPGRTVRELTIESWNWGRHVEWLAKVLAEGASSVVTVRLGAHLVFASAKGRVRLSISVPDTKVLGELQRELAAAPRPLVDEVTVDGPGDASMYAPLLALGRTSKTALTTSPAAEAATFTRSDDTITIDPAREHPVFDVPALRALLEMKKETARRVVISSSASIEEAGAYHRVARAAGARELSLSTRSRSARFTLHASSVDGVAVHLEADVGRNDQVSLLLAAIASFGGRVSKLVVHHTPGLHDFDRLAASLRAVTDTLELQPDERVHAAMFEYTNVKGRVAIHPAGTHVLLLPSTAELILSGKPRPKELRVGQRDFVLAAWLEWVARTKLAVTFAHDWKATVLSKLEWDDGIVARLWAEGRWPAVIASLAVVPDRSIKHLELRSRVAPPEEAASVFRRVALAHHWGP